MNLNTVLEVGDAIEKISDHTGATIVEIIDALAGRAISDTAADLLRLYLIDEIEAQQHREER